MATWVDLYEEVRAAVGNVPLEVVERYVRYATIELCEHAPVWQYDYLGGIAPMPDGTRSISLIQSMADAEAVAATFGYNPAMADATAWLDTLPAAWQVSRERPAPAFAGGCQPVGNIRGARIGAIVANQFQPANRTGVFDVTNAMCPMGFILLAVPTSAPDIENVLVGAGQIEQFRSFVASRTVVELDGVDYKVWHSRTPWVIRGTQRFQVSPITDDGDSYIRRFLNQARVPGSIHGIEWLRVDDYLWEKGSLKNINRLRERYESRNFFFTTGSGGLGRGYDDGYAFEPPIADRGGRVYFAPFVRNAQTVDFEIRLVLKPTVDDAQMPQEASYLLTEYREALVNGAAYRLETMAKERWTNHNAAAVSKQKWDDALESAKRRAEGRRNSTIQRTIYGGIPLNSGYNVGVNVYQSNRNRIVN